MTDSRGNSILDEHFRITAAVSKAILNLYVQACPNMVYTDDLQALENIRAAFEALARPPYTEGQLRRQSNGRWLLSQQRDVEFTSGSPVEVWDGQKWIATRIEHSPSQGGYYRIDGGPLRDGDWVRVPRG